MSRKSGITLPMLIIYLIVLTVIAGAVVINLGNNNQIEELDKSTFQAKIMDYMEQFATMKSYYILKEEFNDEISIIGNDVDIYGRTITDYISSISVEDKEFICIRDGVLHFYNITTDDPRYNYMTELGLTLSNQGDVTYCNISYNSNGGTGEMNNVMVKQGKSVILSNNEFKLDGYFFKGWSITPNGEVRYDNLQTIQVDSDITLYAVWSQGAKVSYVANTTDSVLAMPSNELFVPNTNVKISTNVPVRTGYKFIGWSTNSASTSAQYTSGQQITVNSNITLYAVWKKECTITYVANTTDTVFNIPSSESFAANTNVQINANEPSRKGYKFVGWATSEGSTSVKYTSGQQITINSDITLYAVWKRECTITYVANTIETVTGMPTSQAFLGNDNVKISTNVPTRTYYEFLGWSTNKASTTAQYIKGAPITANTDVTLYAVWKAKGYEYASNNLIAYLDGNFNTQVGYNKNATAWYDIIGNTNNITLTGGTWANNGLVLDGNDDGLNLGSNFKDLFKNNNTIEMVVNIAQEGRDVLIGNNSSNNTINYEKYTLGESRVFVNSGAYNEYSGSNTFDIGTTITISWIWNKTNGTVTQKINGATAHVYTSNEIKNYNYDWTNAYIGRDSRTGATSLKGTLYGIRIYSKALSDNEIKQNYAIDKERYNIEEYARDSLFAFYDGIENIQNGHSSSTTTWYDLTGNSNNATLIGGTWANDGLILDGSDDGLNLGNKFKDLFKNDNTIEMVVNIAEEGRDVLVGNHSASNTINYEKQTSAKSRVYVNGGKYDYTTTTGVFPIGQTVTISWIWNKTNGTVTQKINGATVQVYTNDEIKNYNYDWASAYIGRDIRTGDTSLKGTIYCVRIYNEVLSDTQILRNYNTDKNRF